ncbi:dienelactone hydrolase family protein [Zavarzinia sp. CC-PAN008]|uniref:dienelactone hydrolase family protein n=1 Tax=Zavarzinia sp. CC-PAN008 TaxID=3243332 RepID=UPI003F744958
MSGTEIQVKAKDGSGSFSAYVSNPASGKGPALVVIQEIFGINAQIRGVCDRLAAKGFIAVAPDLFWRQQPGIQLTDQSEAEWKRAFELYQGFNVDKGIEDIAATVDVARTLPGASGKVGSVGYCLGGLLSFLTAARTDVNAAVSYYGGGIHTKLDEVAKVKVPDLLFFAEKDGFIDGEAQAAIAGAVAGHPTITMLTFAGQDHAFAREGGQHYHQGSAEAANDLTEAFFKRHLG